MQDKGKKESYDQSELLGVKPYASIGPGRTSEETAIVGKLKKKKQAMVAKGSTSQDGEKANVGSVSRSIGSFVNRP